LVTKEILKAIFSSKLALKPGVGILFIGIMRRPYSPPSWVNVETGIKPESSNEFLMTFDAQFPLVYEPLPFKMILERTDLETGGTKVSVKNEDFGPTLLYSIVSDGVVYETDISSEPEKFIEFVKIFINFKEDPEGPPLHMIERSLNRVIFVRYTSITGGTDINAELKRIEDEELKDPYWFKLRRRPFHYSLSSYMYPMRETTKKKRTGLLILPDPIFFTFLRIELRPSERLSLHFGDIIVKITDPISSYKIESNSILSHQPYDIIFLNDDMPIEELEKIGIVQKERTMRAKTKLISW
jgi:hypothetical protein